MAHIVSQANLLSPLISLSSSTAVGAASNWCFPVVSLSNLRSLPTRICCAPSPASQIEPQRDERPRSKDFPFAPAPIRDLMVEALSTMESRLGTQLVPYTLPPDVEYYRNESGTDHGSHFILRGAPSSRIDFLLGSWLHSKVPSGGSMDTTSLRCYMNDSSDAPALVMEFIQWGSRLLLITLDLPPRRDLILRPDYLKTFYDDTELDKQRELILGIIPEAWPFVSTSLYVSSAFSPTAITFRVDFMGKRTLEEIVRGEVSVAAKNVLETWLEVCACGDKGEVTQENDRAYLKKRDARFKGMTIGVDIGAKLCGRFSEEIVDRVLGEFRVLVDSRG